MSSETFYSNICENPIFSTIANANIIYVKKCEQCKVERSRFRLGKARTLAVPVRTSGSTPKFNARQVTIEPVVVNLLRSPGIDSQPGGIDCLESIPV
jgi:hypothetical protein